MFFNESYTFYFVLGVQIVDLLSRTPSRKVQGDFSDPQNWQKPVVDAVGGSQDDGKEAFDINFGEPGRGLHSKLYRCLYSNCPKPHFIRFAPVSKHQLQ